MSYRQSAVPHAAEDANRPKFETKEVPIPEALTGDDVLLKVLACGVCYSDVFSVTGGMGAKFPVVAGHEVVGKVVKAGPGAVAQTFAKDTVVGVGWHGGHCRSCEACTAGDFMCCEKGVITGVHKHGGFQEYAVASADVLARVPTGMDPVEAAPIMCAGVTVFNALRSNNDQAKPPALIAVLGIGGLGHLAIQYAAKMGYTVVAISRGPAKKEAALKLGATHFIDSKTQNVASALQELGGARMVLGTPPSGEAMGACIDGLTRRGKLVVIGAGVDTANIPVTVFQLIKFGKSVVGHPAGTARDIQDSLEFAQVHGIKPTTVVFKGIEKTPEAYTAMRKGEYRVVIKMSDD